MQRTQSLNGLWRAEGFGPDGEKLALPAAVPGMIHLDLEREGVIPPMFWRDNAEQCQWVEDWTWVYSTTFEVAADADLRWAALEFGGLDTYAEIELNGEPLAVTADAQVPFRFDVGARLLRGENALRVTFTPYKPHLAGKRMDYVAAFNRSDRVHVRRMQCTFYWDWVNRFVTAGPWRPVTLYYYDETRIEDLFVRTHDIAKTSASLCVELETAIRSDLLGRFQATGEADLPPETARFGDLGNPQVAYAERPVYVPYAEVTITDPDGRAVWHRRMNVYTPCIRLQADLRDARLWWPVGYGGQPLYRCEAKVFAPDGRLLDESSRTFGIRTTRVEQLDDEPGSPEAEKTAGLRNVYNEHRNDDRPGCGFTLLVNGERILCKGGNWVPADPFPCRITEEKYDRLIRYAAEANLNLLRCWGGGIYEPDAFFDACDRYGVMVSEDFQLACARFPEDDEEFMDKMRHELPVAIRHLRNHASVVWYAGDNENACHYDWDDPGAPGVRLCRELYHPLLAALDPSRPFFPTSPWGSHNNSCASVGDSHLTWYYEPNGYREGLKATSRFMSECVTQGSLLFTSLRKFMTDEDIADPEYKMFDYHVKDNPHKAPGTPTLYVRSREVSDSMFGAPADTAAKIRQDSYMQYEWTRLTIEATRRRKWFSSGVQFWMYNDCWPAVGLSLVDYYLVPKAGYFGAKHASAPVAVSINDVKNGYEVWICNDSLTAARGTCEIFVQRHTGEKLPVASVPFVSTANQNQIAAYLPAEKLPCPLDGGCQLVAAIRGEFGATRAQFTPAIPRDMVFPKVALTAGIAPASESTGTITFTATGYARIVTVDGDCALSDNFFDLLPGETRTVAYECLNGYDIRDAEIYCWNME